MRQVHISTNELVLSRRLLYKPHSIPVSVLERKSGVISRENIWATLPNQSVLQRFINMENLRVEKTLCLISDFFYWNNPYIENTIRDLYWRQGENHETWKKEHADWRNPQEFIYLWQKTTTVLSVRLQSQFNWKGTTKYNETRVTFETTEHILKFKNGEWNGFWLISLYQEESGSRHNGAPMSKHYD